MDTSKWPKCEQCGRAMTPADYMIGSVCMSCCRANHAKALGRKPQRKKKRR